MGFAIGAGGVRLEVKGLQGMVTLVGLGLTGAAIAEQLRRPPADRTWQGHLWGFVPYDFRLPTLERLWRAIWDPENEHFLKDKTFGVGWT